MSEQPESGLERLEPRVEFSITPEMEVGVYASFANLWHDNDVFTIDFTAVTQPPQPAEDDLGQAYVRVQGRVVARVRIPPNQVFELMKALELQLSAWEAANHPT